MNDVELDRDRVVFPARCVRCGKPPGGFYRLDAHKIPPIVVPLCIGCVRRRVLPRALVVVTALALVPLVVVAAALLFEALALPRVAVAQRETAVLAMTFAAIAAGLVAGVLAGRFGLRRLAARAPVVVRGQSAEGTRVTLGIADAQLARDVVALSTGHDARSYRDGALVPFQPWKGGPIWMLPLVFAGVAALGASDATRECERPVRTGLASLVEGLLCALGGPIALGAFWIAFALAGVALSGVLVWLRVRSGRSLLS